MLSKFFSKKSRGFTLVELLIVVAIIGVLSTLGVPTFRRMIQKSKKSEAKVNLGAVFTAESAFQAEYSVFGNNLNRIGFDIDGNPLTMTYRVGFFGTSSCAGATTARPTSGSQVTALNTAFPTYYSSFNASGADAWRGYSQLNSGCVNVAADSAADGTTFIATAQGAVSPSVDKANPGSVIDVWTINNSRTLVNTNDGVQ